MIPKSGNRFPAFAKHALAGEGRSDKIMRRLFELQTDDPHETVRQLPITFQPGRVGDQHARMIEI
jgi:hypothetical protein